MKLTKQSVGVVSKGTMKYDDLLKAFKEELKEIALHAKLSMDSEFESPKVDIESGDVDYEELTNFIEQLDKLISEMEKSENWEEEDWAENVAWTVNELCIEFFNSIAPEGYYFGSNKGSSADIGFWEIDLEEVE